MIFQHTLKSVLSGEKTQTSRRWQDTWKLVYDDTHYGDKPYNQLFANERLQYYVGQTLAIQPARGKKSIGRIEITSLAKRSVIDFTGDDIRREGFGVNSLDFALTWLEMHNPSAYRHATIGSDLRQLINRINEGLKTCDMALVIGFKLVEVY